MLEVGVLEESWVLEAVAEEAVEGYVGGPDEGDGGGSGPVVEIAAEEEDEGKGLGVGEVVGCCSYFGVEEITEHAEVRSEEEDGE